MYRDRSSLIRRTEPIKKPWSAEDGDQGAQDFSKSPGRVKTPEGNSLRRVRDDDVTANALLAVFPVLGAQRYPPQRSKSDGRVDRLGS
jgi:hypothetical protein